MVVVVANAILKKMKLNPHPSLRKRKGFLTGNTLVPEGTITLLNNPGMQAFVDPSLNSISKHDQNGLPSPPYKEKELFSTMVPPIRVSTLMWVSSLQNCAASLGSLSSLGNAVDLSQRWLNQVIWVPFTPLGVYFSCLFVLLSHKECYFFIKRGLRCLLTHFIKQK